MDRQACTLLLPCKSEPKHSLLFERKYPWQQCNNTAFGYNILQIVHSVTTLLNFPLGSVHREFALGNLLKKYGLANLSADSQTWAGRESREGVQGTPAYFPRKKMPGHVLILLAACLVSCIDRSFTHFAVVYWLWAPTHHVKHIVGAVNFTVDTIKNSWIYSRNVHFNIPS